MRTGSTQTDYGKARFRRRTIHFDLAIEGDGFFKVKDPNGDFLYTRAGNFGLNANNQMVLGSAYNGYVLDPPITIPQDATGVVITTDGQVQYSTQNNTTLHNRGQIQLAKFVNPDGLIKLGDNLYQKTDASGEATDNNPAKNGYGDDPTGFFGSVERRAGERADRSDHDAAVVRAQFAGGASRRPDHADRGQSEAILLVG